MAANGNGTARKALITGAIGLAFSALAWGANNIMVRIAYLERESDRVGKIAAGRGDKIKALEDRVLALEGAVRRVELFQASRRYRQPPAEAAE